MDSTSNNNAILSNSIFANAGLGIDLFRDGVTANDPGDGDSGGNQRQNFPVLTSASRDGVSTTIAGTLNSSPNLSYTLEFFASAVAEPSGFGEGQRFLGSSTVTTDDTREGGFTVTLDAAVAEGASITATATDANNNTSEFSAAIVAESIRADLQLSAAPGGTGVAGEESRTSSRFTMPGPRTPVSLSPCRFCRIQPPPCSTSTSATDTDTTWPSRGS